MIRICFHVDLTLFRNEHAWQYKWCWKCLFDENLILQQQTVFLSNLMEHKRMQLLYVQHYKEGFDDFRRNSQYSDSKLKNILYRKIKLIRYIQNTCIHKNIFITTKTAGKYLRWYIMFFKKALRYQTIRSSRKLCLLFTDGTGEKKSWKCVVFPTVLQTSPHFMKLK